MSFNNLLIRTSFKCDIEGVKIAISKGADNFNDGLTIACANGHKKMVQLMISHGADDFNQGLIEASSCGYIDIVQLMISHGANNFNDGLWCACEGDYIDIVKLMISHGANDLNDRLVGACTGKTEIINLLVLKMKYIPRCCKNLSREQLYLFYKSGVTPSINYGRQFERMKRVDKEVSILTEELLIRDLSAVISDY